MRETVNSNQHEHKDNMRICALFLLLQLPWAASAQTATTASKYAWEQTAPDLVTAQGYTYRVYVDTGTGQPLVGVTCTVSSTAGIFTCTAPLLAVTPGPHAATLTASNGAGESAKSATVTFTFVAIPTSPSNPRIQ